MELVQRQTQQLTQQTLQSLALLQMSTVELEAYVQELAQENPIIDLEPPRSEQEAPRDQELFRRVKWLEDSDRQNRYYQRLDAEELDPLAQVGTDGGLEESLSNFLFRQIQQLDLDESAKQLLCYLSACLDEDGYFRIPLDELSRTSGISQRRLARTLELLRSLEPAGVGASSLSQCLELQLLRIHEEGPALAIVRDCLEELAKKHYHAISARLSISQEEVRSAERLIRELNPRPGSIFALPSEISYIQPDILIEEMDGHFTARLRNSDRPYFQINSYYRSLLTQSDDAQVREYLTLKLRQAENVLWAIGQRETTLLRCAQAIAGRQQDFFRSGPSALRPLRLSDIAQELEIHESTVSRAIRDKYVQCPRGVFPLRHFLSRRAAGESGAEVGSCAAKELLRRLIREEDSTKPLQIPRGAEHPQCLWEKAAVARHCSGPGQSVHPEDHAGDIGCLLRGQEYEGLRDLPRLPHTPQGDLGLQRSQHLPRHCPQHVRLDDARGHRIDPYPLRRQLPGQGQGEAVDRELGDRIGDAGGLSIEAHHGGGVQDHASALPLHPGHRPTGTVEHSLYVQVHHPVKELPGVRPKGRAL